MPDFTLTFSHQTVARLQIEADRSNRANNTSYTLLEWIRFLVIERAIVQDLQPLIATIQEQEQKDANERLTTAIKVEHDRLVDLLEAEA